MNNLQNLDDISFSSALPILVYHRPQDDPMADWQEFDRGPGYFRLPLNSEVAVRIQNIDDFILAELADELVKCHALRFLNLSENRKITNHGMQALTSLTQLTALNLSSCDITYEGLIPLTKLPNLTHLDLSYCNRLNNNSVKYLAQLTRLKYLDLQGALKINQAGFTRLERRGLTIHK